MSPRRGRDARRMALAGLVVATVIVTLVVGVAPGLEAAPATRQQWVSTYRGPRKLGAQAYATAVSPDGSTVFVTGTSTGFTGYDYDWATVAYGATDGRLLWDERYSTKGNLDDVPLACAAAPDGSMLFVTGFSRAPSGTAGMTTLA